MTREEQKLAELAERKKIALHNVKREDRQAIRRRMVEAEFDCATVQDSNAKHALATMPRKVRRAIARDVAKQTWKEKRGLINA
jgi:hypothetical protein